MTQPPPLPADKGKMEITAGHPHIPQLQAPPPAERGVSVSSADRPHFSDVLQPTPSPAPISTAPEVAGHATQALMALVENTSLAGKRVDAMLAAVQSGKTFTPTQLLALQNETFRYSQSVEVLSRTTDRLVGGLKQILGTPV